MKCCLIVLLHKEESDSDKLVNAIITASDNNKLLELIIYEIILKEKPVLAYWINQKIMGDLMDYILTIRTDKL